MTLFIVAFGTLTSLVGLAIFLDSKFVFGPLRQHLDKIELHVSAVAV